MKKNEEKALGSKGEPSLHSTAPQDRLGEPASYDRWQPIETAPKDGRHIIVFGDGLPATVHWFDGGWHLSVNQRGEFSEYIWRAPTHWMSWSVPK
jgi:hypothetical protein